MKKNISRTVQLAIFCFPVISGISKAESVSGDSAAIQEMEHMAVRSQREVILASEFIDTFKIRHPMDSKTVDGQLADLAGIDLRRSSPAAGKGTGVFIRGLDESRSLILLNGRPLNGAGVMGGDYVDWALLPLADVKRVEVLRGVKSAEYGNTLGGVINIITRGDITAPSFTRAQISYGMVGPEHAEDSWKNRTTEASVSHHANILGTASLDLHASYGSAQPYLRNNYNERTGLAGELSLILPLEFRANAGIHHTMQRRGFAIGNSKDAANYDPDYPESKEYAGGGPGISWKGGNYYFGDRSYWTNIRTQFDFSLQKELPNLLITALAHVNDQDRTEYFYAITDTNRLVLERYAKPEKNTWGTNLTIRQTIGSQTLIYGGETSSLRYSNSDIRQCDSAYFRFQPEDGDPSTTIRAADRYGAFIQSFLKFGERLEASPGIRYDYYIGFKRDSLSDETRFQGASPNVGLKGRFWKGGETALQAAYAYRFPTCPELYWYYGGYMPANRKALSPERAIQLEGGLSQRLNFHNNIFGSLGVRGYYYHINDYIRTIFGYQPSRLVYNIDAVSLVGCEAEASFDLWRFINVKCNYTYQQTAKSGDIFDSSMALTKGLPELPRHKSNMSIEYKAPNAATVGLLVRFVGSRDVITGSLAKSNAAVLEHIEPFAVFRLYGAMPIWSKDNFSAAVKAGIDNLFDTEYSEYPGIPMPGITGTAVLEVTF